MKNTQSVLTCCNNVDRVITTLRKTAWTAMNCEFISEHMVLQWTFLSWISQTSKTYWHKSKNIPPKLMSTFPVQYWIFTCY